MVNLNSSCFSAGSFVPSSVQTCETQYVESLFDDRGPLKRPNRNQAVPRLAEDTVPAWCETVTRAARHVPNDARARSSQKNGTRRPYNHDQFPQYALGGDGNLTGIVRAAFLLRPPRILVFRRSFVFKWRRQPAGMASALTQTASNTWPSGSSKDRL